MKNLHLEPENEKARKPRVLQWMCSWVHRQNGTSTCGLSWARPYKNWNVRNLATSCSWLSHTLQHTYFQNCSFHCFLPIVMQKYSLTYSTHNFHKTSLRLSNRNHYLHLLCYLLSGCFLIKGIISPFLFKARCEWGYSLMTKIKVPKGFCLLYAYHIPLNIPQSSNISRLFTYLNHFFGLLRKN